MTLMQKQTEKEAYQSDLKSSFILHQSASIWFQWHYTHIVWTHWYHIRDVVEGWEQSHLCCSASSHPWIGTLHTRGRPHSLQNFAYLYIKEKLIFCPVSRDNRRMPTPKTTYNLNQHDRGNVLGHFLFGLGSWVGCRNRFINRWVKEVFITKKQAQLTVPRQFWGWSSSPHCKLDRPRKQPNLMMQSTWSQVSTKHMTQQSGSSLPALSRGPTSCWA